MKSLYVLSDLHIAPEGALNSFHQAEALTDFLVQLPRDACLVLAGDTFDLLEIAGRPERLDWMGAAELLGDALQRIARQGWGRPMLDALAAFITEGGQCVVLPGNHDVELFHPACEVVLREALRLRDAGKLQVWREGTPFVLRIGAREVMVGHGNRGDAWNDVDPAGVHASLRQGATDQALPPGSMLVLRTLNAFKRALDPISGQPRFPFVDKLKPEKPGVALLLLYLDPALACQHLPGVAGPSARALLRALQARLRGGATLGSPRNDETATVIDEIARGIVDGMDASELAAPEATLRSIELALDGQVGDSAPGILATHGGRLRPLLRSAVRRLSYRGTFFDRGAMGTIDRAIVESLLPATVQNRVVIAGHTHAAREVCLPGDRLYLNTGTWSDLLEFPANTSDSGLKRWIDDLEGGRLPPLRRRTYALVDGEGGHLREWGES